MRSIRPDTIVGGRITLNEILLKSVSVDRSVDITDMVDSFNLFEDIFTNTLTGNMNLGDTANLIANFPIVGHEEVHITMGTPNIDKPIRPNSPQQQYDEAPVPPSIKEEA